MKTYGEVHYDAKHGRWAVKCEPHVAIRLRRVFAGQGKAAREFYSITDTLDNCRDLAWFVERYPMTVYHRDRLDQRASAHVERTSLVDGLLSRATAPEAFDLAVPAREYQKIAASMMLARGGLLLADDVGLGKTASFICALTDARTRPAVVVTLTHLPRQWRSEIEKFAPGLRVHIVTQGQPYDISTACRKARNGQTSLFDGLPDVTILNYHKLSGWAETLAKFAKSVCFDEVQELRRTGSQKYSAARVLAGACALRVGLSATPIYNFGGEMYSVLDCLFPGALGSAGEFAEQWCAGWIEKIKDPKAFSYYLRDEGMMLRRTRHDVGRELPPVTRIPHTVDCDPARLDELSGNCAALAKFILSSNQGVERGAKMRASEEFSNALRQATGISKAPYVADFVRLLLESGERKIVLYGWHREVYSIWLDRLKDFKPVMYTGSESVNQKDAAKAAFVDGDARVLMISLRAGAGLDGLQKACRTVVFGELDWSPGVHEQCVGRVARDGQPDPVAAYFLVAEDGADPYMAQVLGLKKQQSDAIRDPDAALVEDLQADENRVRGLAAAYLERGSVVREEAA